MARGISLESKKIEYIANRFAETTTVLLVLPYDEVQGENRVKEMGKENIYFKDVVKLIQNNKSCTVSLVDCDDPILTEDVFKEFEHGNAERKDMKRKAAVDAEAKFGPLHVNEQERPRVRRASAHGAGLCVICQDERAVFCVLPCNHVCYCEGCTPAVVGEGDSCPICRGDVFRTMRIYFP